MWMRLSTLVCAILLTAAYSSASVAYEFYVTIEGATQGLLRGQTGNDVQDHRIPAYSLELPDSAADKASLVFVKEIGAASTQLFKATADGEMLTSVTLEFCRSRLDGGEYVYYMVRLSNARITRLTHFVDPGRRGAHQQEEVTLSYESCEERLAKGCEKPRGLMLRPDDRRMRRLPDQMGSTGAIENKYVDLVQTLLLMRQREERIVTIDKLEREVQEGELSSTDTPCAPSAATQPAP